MLTLRNSRVLPHPTTNTKSQGAFPPSDRDRILDLLFSLKNGGLGLQVARYNIGGSGWATPDARCFRAGANVPAYAGGPGRAYDWTADAAQRACLLGARDRGASNFEAFANSPPFWMTKSGRASGAAWGWASNLPKNAVGDFADYLVDVVSHFHTDHALHFATIAPFNEPCEISWWAGTNQEGCRFTPRQQRRVVTALAARLRAAGLLAPAGSPPRPADVTIAVSDENRVDRATSSLEAALSSRVRLRRRPPRTRPADGAPPTAQSGGVVATLAGLAPADLAAIGRVNTHAYAGGRARPALAAVAALASKPVWMSEVGFGCAPPSHPASASALAAGVAADVNALGAVGWVYWQAVEDADGGAWKGLLSSPFPLSSLPFRFGFACANWWWATKQAVKGAAVAVKKGRDAAAEYFSPWWGLVLVSFSGKAGPPSTLTLSKQFYGLAQYSRSVRAGWRILAVPPERAADTVMALSPDGSVAAIVATNDTDAPRDAAFDLTPFLAKAAAAGAGGKGEGKKKGGAEPACPAPLSAWVRVTRTDADHDCADVGMVTVAGGGGSGAEALLEVRLPPRSVTTYEVRLRTAEA
jgi:O-glycosyl hydrolase